MSDRPEANEIDGAVSPRGSETIPLVAFVFVIFALVALALTPALILQRISRSTEQITSTVLPAYEALRNLEFAMEQRISASRSLFLTGDASYRRAMAQAAAAEASSLGTVMAVAPGLGDAAVNHALALQRNIARRDSLVADLLASGVSVERYQAALPRFDALRDSMLVHMAGLENELVQAAEGRIAQEVRWADRQRMVSALLGGVAMLAAVAVGWFALQQRRLRRGIQRALRAANRARAIAVRQREELARSAESRVRLLRGITHDVKNPLGAAKGYVDLLDMGIKAPLLPEQAPLVEGVRRSIDGALSILADLLDLARADSGGLSVERVEVDLGALVRMAVADHRSAATAAGHSIETEVPAEPVQVHTDPARVQQVLANLLSNAIKYTPPPGRINVGAERGGRRDGPREGEWATIRVRDSGPGIPLEEREAVFDEFSRLHEGGGQKGHGLGLAIARRIARLLDGDLTAEGEPGEGATFVLWLPLRRMEAPAAPTGGDGAESRFGLAAGRERYNSGNATR